LVVQTIYGKKYGFCKIALQNGGEIQDGRQTLPYPLGPTKYNSKWSQYSRWRFYISLSEPCIFAIFKPPIFKFWILIEDFIRINGRFVFFD
jgi:hypothetical protein